METPKRFDLVLQALTELAPEIQALPRTNLVPQNPTLQDVMDNLGTLPKNALFLGMAEDGLPILLDLNDASPGPLLVAGDTGSGKTTLLKLIAAATAEMHSEDDVQFGVITNSPEEWEALDVLANNAGIYPLYDSAAADFILGLTAWAHNNRNSRQAVLLLVDDLVEVTGKMDLEALQNLRWLLLRGPNRRVWPIVSVDTNSYGEVLPWLDAFRTRMFGRVASANAAEDLALSSRAGLEALEIGQQFALREGRNWLKFWIPTINMEE